MRAGPFAVQANAGLAIGIILTIFRRFWAAAARWKLVSCAIGASHSQAIQLPDALEVGEQHLDLRPLAALHKICVGGGDTRATSFGMP